MSYYISSNNNRFYVALESAYGSVPAITGQNRIPGVKLAAKQVLEQSSRRDNIGEPHVCGFTEPNPKAHQFSTEHLHDGVGEWADSAESWAVISGGDGRESGGVRRRNGGANQC